MSLFQSNLGFSFVHVRHSGLSNRPRKLQEPVDHASEAIDEKWPQQAALIVCKETSKLLEASMALAANESA